MGTEGKHFDTIKPRYDKLTVNNILNREELKSFPLRSRQGCTHSPLFFNIVFKVLATATSEEKETKGNQTGKKEVKLSLFAGNMVLLYIENPKDTTRKLLEIVN